MPMVKTYALTNQWTANDWQPAMDALVTNFGQDHDFAFSPDA